jgi:hypothetical protein
VPAIRNNADAGKIDPRPIAWLGENRVAGRKSGLDNRRFHARVSFNDQGRVLKMPKKALMTPGPKAPDAVRRSLLTGGALTVAASAALLAGRSRAEVADGAADAAAPSDPARPAYRVTDHIAAYYRRARG